MRTKNWKQALSMLLAVALMATLLVVPAAAAGEMVLDMAKNSATVTASTMNDLGGGFKYNASSSDAIATKAFTFSDGYSAGRAIKLGGTSNASGNRRTVNFTTTAATTVKVWWYDHNSSGGTTMNLWSGTATTASSGTTTQESTATYQITTFADVPAGDIRIGCVSGKAHIYKVEAAPKSTTSAFVTGVKITDDKDNENLNADVRSADVTLNLKAAVTGGTSGTVQSWTVKDSEGNVPSTITITPGSDNKTATVKVSKDAVRGQYTISATSTDPQQNETEDDTTGFTGTATLRVRRAVVDTMTLTAPSDSAVAMKMGDEPVAVEIKTTWVTADGDCIIQPASDADQVTFKSNDTNVVTVDTGTTDNDGKATLTAVGVGSTTVTATSTRNDVDGQPKVVTLNVTVNQGDVTLGLVTRNQGVAAAGNYVLAQVTGLPEGVDATSVVKLYDSENNEVTGKISAPEGDESTQDNGNWNVKVTLDPNETNDDKTYTLKAKFDGNTNYAASDEVTATLTVRGQDAKVIRITGVTANQSLTAGDALTLTLTAVVNDKDGAVNPQPTINYQWKKDNAEISGAIDATYTKASVGVADAGTYTCTVTSEGAAADREVKVEVSVAQKEGTVPTADVNAATRELSGIQDGWKYSLDGNGETAHWVTISGSSEGKITIPDTIEGVDMTAVQGIYVQDPGDDDTLPATQHIELTRATTPVLEAADGALKITNYQSDYESLYQYKTKDATDWTDATVAVAADGQSATISGLTNGTVYQVRVKYGKYILGTIVPAEGTPAEPAGDPTALKEAIQAAKNKVIGIWYADNAADVADTAKFVSVSDGTAYNTAIAKAEGVANSNTATTTELNAAAAELATAVSNFEALEKKDGTKHSTAFVLNMNEVTKQEIANQPKGTAANTVANLGTQGFFTLLGNKDSGKLAGVEDGDALFADGFYGYQRWNSQGKVELASKQYYKGVQFTTTVANATVKVWARNGGSSTRTMGVIGQAAVSGTPTVNAGETAVVTMTLGAAGTYYLGGTDNTLHIFRVEVVQPGVDPNPSAYDITIADTESKGTVTTQVGTDEVTEAYEGDTVKVVAVGADGYVVDTISVTKTASGEAVTVADDKTFTMPGEAVTVTVTFKEGQATKYTVTVVGGTADKTEAVEGEKVTVTAGQPEAGKVFDKWTATGVTLADATESTVEFNMPAANVTLTATYKDAAATEYNITVTAGANGTASASAAKAAEGTKITLTVTPAAGYEVDQITSSDVTVAADKTFTMPAKDVAINVTFKQSTVTPGDKYAVTVADTENGTVSVDKTEAAEGDTVTITAEPADGYEVDAIKVTKADNSEVTVADDNTFVMPAEAVTVTVTFKATTVTPPTVDKTELTAAIEAAEAIDTTSVAVSEDGTDVPTSEKWIAKSVKDAFDKALADAQAVADKANATQTEVDEAKEALTEAADALKAAIENAANGTKPVTKDDLTAAIAAADKAAKAITVDTDAKNVKKGTKWVTAEVKEAYETAIAAAQAVADNADATADEVAQALADLNTATRTFEAAQQDGTKASRPTGGGGIPGGVGVDNNTNKKNETLSDGTKRVTETAKDGTVTVTDTKPDGTKSVTVTTPAGEVTTTVTLGRDVDNAQVSVPVDDKAESGMVAVIVKPDGTEEIIRDSVVVDGDMVFDLDESATVKIVNNAKHFVDIDGHWAKSDVDYVTARELFNGVDATHFAPDTTMTRGMMATVLFRLDGEVKSGKSVDFSDVVADDWFAAAVDWAAEAGVINGYTDGTFGPNSSITREELVVMVYRYAGAPAVNGKDLNGFTDADDVADWAAAAMTWAIQNGIIQGKGNDILDPKGNATRAEVSAVLQRYVRLSK